MAWFPKQLSDLPFLLVGPILRKVTPISVSIFLATKEQCSAKIHVYKYDKSNPNNSERVGFSSTASPFRKIGVNLYVNVVTLNLVTPLERNVLYGYDIQFDQVGVPTRYLSSLGDTRSSLFIYPIVGEEMFPKFQNANLNNGTKVALPTFILPSETYDGLRFLHASCRKPHGEGPDALGLAASTLYYPIHQYIFSNSELQKRPQMLFLTGDQIYADDVSEMMLYMINKYADLLVGWDEDLSSLGYDNSNSAPGRRANNITTVANFSVDEADCGSHLVKLREYIVMYCMVWSANFWQLDDPSDYNSLSLPSFSEVFPQAQDYIYTEQTITLDEIYLPDVSYTQTTKTNALKKYEDMCNRLKFFFKTIHRGVPFVLANTPTYMIFDDHEVTDDFLFNGQWFQDAIVNSALGRRISTNGMAAYAIFQDWGNKPEDYINGQPGETLLNNMESLVTASNKSPFFDAITNIVLPELDQSSTPSRLKHKSNSLNWHYQYEVPNKYEFLVLDTRTMRVFNNGIAGVSGLMSSQALDLQIKSTNTNRNQPLLIVVSPTPVIGISEIERRKDEGLNFGELFGKEFLKTIYRLDLESWSYDKAAYEELFAVLVKRNYPNIQQQRVILLGGDVHYAYSHILEYWGNRPYKDNLYPSPFRMKIAALCASSSKNEVSEGNASGIQKVPSLEGYSRAFHSLLLNKRTDASAVYGWNNIPPQKIEFGTFKLHAGVITMDEFPYVKFENSSPMTFDNNTQELVTYDPIWGTKRTSYEPHEAPDPVEEWHYRLSPIKRIENVPYPPSVNNGYTLDSYSNHLEEHKKRYENGSEGGAYIVGVNNIGDVMLETDSNGALKYVMHQIWWMPDKERASYLSSAVFNLGLPYTIHKLDMSFNPKPKLNE